MAKREVKKLTKDELRSPDAFQAYGRQIADFLAKNQAVFIALILAVVLGSLSWLGYSRWQQHREEVATQKFYPVEKSLEESVEKSKTVTDSDLSQYETVLKDQSGTKAALVSVITVAPEILKAGKADVLSRWFKELTYQPRENDVQFGLMKMTQGLALMESHQADEAITVYNQILSSDGQKTFQPAALLKMGVAYEMKKDMTKAKEMFEKVRKEHPATPAGELAFQYLLYLDQKNPPASPSAG